MKKRLSYHDDAVRLCEGGFIEFGGLIIGAKEVEEEESCFECAMDSICNFEMTELCAECDELTRKRHILYMPNP